MATKLWAIGLVVLTTVFTSSAQILYKMGMDNFSYDLPSLITNYWLFGGALLYLIGAVMLVVALKHGELSVLYPIVATSYIWVSLMSALLFNEVMNPWKWGGVFSIIVGVSFIGLGSKK